jgi:hypothetical protein
MFTRRGTNVSDEFKIKYGVWLGMAIGIAVSFIVWTAGPPILGRLHPEIVVDAKEENLVITPEKRATMLKILDGMSRELDHLQHNYDSLDKDTQSMEEALKRFHAAADPMPLYQPSHNLK